MRSSITRRDFLRGSLAAAPLLGLASTLQAQGRRRLPFTLGAITDEISDDLDFALDFIASYRLHGCELRDIWGQNIMNSKPEDLAKARHLIQDYNMRVSDIASPIFKYDLPQMRAHPEMPDRSFGAAFTDKNSDELLMKSFSLAHYFGTKKVRVFSYSRVKEPEKAYPYVRDRLAKAAEMAGKNDILLVLENEMDCNVGTGVELGRILKDINNPNLRGNWDPGNAVMLGEVPYPNGYNAVKGWFAHMHVKDARKDPATGRLTWAPVGAGVIDWKGQIKAVLDSGYNGTMSLETHYRRADGNRVESSRESLLGLLKIIHEEA
ncbi:MAG TPA: sugar phosphate isomerase/epimerase family protein [Terriglobia bacterium]|nr:sugar phosphate isomerase/epimerase family protein [Terriglobia bacterium]